MKILCTGTAVRLEELKLKLSSHELIFTGYNDIEFPQHSDANLIIDLQFDENPDEGLEFISRFPDIPVIASVAQISHTRLHTIDKREHGTVFGLNALPTFINRPLWEMTVGAESDIEKLTELCRKLGVDFRIVDDRVGMVTPRIVYMIINEAYFTVQEGTAERADIDTAMKLGTNYPMGPFEWSVKTGLRNVYNLLENIYRDTHDERYKICPLLKREAMTAESI